MVDPDADLRPIVGGRTAAALEKAFGIRTVEGALRHYPRRYLQRGELSDLSSLRVDEDVTVLARIESVKSRPAKNRRGGKPTWMTEVVITDGRGRLRVTFFNQKWRDAQLQPGRSGLFAGRVGSYRGARQLVHPDHLDLSGADPDAIDQFAGAVIPIYPGTSAMPSWRVARALSLVLPMAAEFPDPLPEAWREEKGLMALPDALAAVHNPRSMDEVERARDRLRWEEAFILQTSLLARRTARRARTAVARRPVSDGLVGRLDAALPFPLTSGQHAVGEEIAADMASSEPMLRLLQGDVGSGKTVVALRAMLAAVDAGAQAVLLAPTEVLAAQHLHTIQGLLGALGRRGQIDGDPAGTAVVLLTGSQGAAARREALLMIASGEAGIVVGTHALFSDKVQFADLGLVVVDEQHRFGVEQRASLTDAAPGESQPHQLVMTATPIPRTVAMTVFGDLDVSTLEEKPAARQPVATHVVPVGERPDYLDRAWQRLREEVSAGGKAFIVCPRITDDAGEEGMQLLDPDSSDEPGSPPSRDRPPHYPPDSVSALSTHLANGPLAGLRIGAVHGRMSADEKDAVMAAFAAESKDPAALDVLVATTVIEVGIDIPAATLMVIIDAHRFGVSSLHQLRGRVGRGDQSGLCLLVTDVASGTPAGERLSAVAATDDGFQLSLIDLRQRREGDVLGAHQSGRANSLRLLSVLDDASIIADARAAAAAVLSEDPQLEAHPHLRESVLRLEGHEAAVFLERA